MGKKTRSRKQKQITSQKRKQQNKVGLEQTATLINQVNNKFGDYRSDPINKPTKPEISIYAYPVALVKKDLLRSIILAFIALVCLLIFRQYLG